MMQAVRQRTKTPLRAGLLVVLTWLAVAGCGQPGTSGPESSAALGGEVGEVLLVAQADPGTDAPAKSRKAPASKERPVAEHPYPRRIDAPSLDGGIAWLNTSEPLDLEDLRGKFVLLDFWTYCCINCMHILPELKKLEHAYPNNIVVIGVHSAKFDEEKDSENIASAIMRHEIEHPVVNDAEHVIWNKYAVTSWPSLRVIDPEGNLVDGHSGELSFEDLDRYFKKVLPYYRTRGLLNETPIKFDLEASKARSTPLRYPGKVLADEASGRLFIADSNHNRIVVSSLNGELLDVIGSGALGRGDGDYATAEFNHPQGMALHGETLYVADTDNHLIRKVDLTEKKVTTIAGTGTQLRGSWPTSGRPLKTEIASPWALLVHNGDLYIAMAGPHQIWKMPLKENEIGPYAGNGREDIVDGPLLPRRPYETGFASFAQPSGLASDGEWLYVADSEGSSVRAVPFNPKKQVKTVVGTASLPAGRLFTFGDVDGSGEGVRLQHVLGITFHDGLLYIADTYNNKIKEIEPKSGTVRTIAGTGESGSTDEPATFDEPAGISSAAGKLYVADTNNHLIRTIDLKTGVVATLEIKGLTPPEPPEPKATAKKPLGFPGATEVRLPAVTVKPKEGAIQVSAKVELPIGYKINKLAPMKYLVQASSAAGPVDRETIGKMVNLKDPSTEFSFTIPIKEVSGTDTLKISVPINYCQEGDSGLCKITAVAWVVPVTVSDDAEASEIQLTHVVK